MLLWNLNETAKQLGNVSTRTVRRLMERGELPCVRVGRLIRIPSRAVIEWMEQRITLAHNPTRAGPGVRRKEIYACHTDAKTVPFGGCLTPTQAARELDALLKPLTARKP